MEMTPSPLHQMFSTASGSEGYQPCYPSDSTGIEPENSNLKSAHDAEQESLPRRAATTRVPRHTGDREEVWRTDGDGTGDTIVDGGQQRRAPGKAPRDSWDREGDDRHPHEDAKEAVCGKTGSEDQCHCRHVNFLIGSYPPVHKDAVHQRIDKLDDTTSGVLKDQAIFDNGVKTMRFLREVYKAKLGSMLPQHQRDVDTMIKFLETGQNRMRD